MIDVFNLGLSNNKWDDLTNLFAKEKIMNNAIEAGLIIKSNNKTYDRFRNRIMFLLETQLILLVLEQEFIIQKTELNI